jgi:hypothetical protein
MAIPGDGVFVAAAGWPWSSFSPVDDPNRLEGSVRTSMDAIEWETVLEVDGSVSGVAASDDLVVAVGAGRDGGGVAFSSTDTRRWSDPTVFPDPLRSVAYDDGRWVAVGADHAADPVTGGGVVYVSDDGRDWSLAARTTPATDMEGHELLSIEHGPGGWIAAGVDCPGPGRCTSVFVASDDGTSWSPVAAGTRVHEPLVVATDDSWALLGREVLEVDDPLEFAYGGLVLGRSDNGREWEEEVDDVDGSPLILGAAPDEGGFVGVGFWEYHIGGSGALGHVAVMTSRDLLAWDLLVEWPEDGPVGSASDRLNDVVAVDGDRFLGREGDGDVPAAGTVDAGEAAPEPPDDPPAGDEPEPAPEGDPSPEPDPPAGSDDDDGADVAGDPAPPPDPAPEDPSPEEPPPATPGPDDEAFESEAPTDEWMRQHLEECIPKVEADPYDPAWSYYTEQGLDPEGVCIVLVAS